MGRSRRSDPPAGWHHLTNRGARRYDIFVDDEDRRAFLRLLRRSAAKHDTEVVAYCLMGNHFHVVLYCPDGGVSATMHETCSAYVRSFNNDHGFDGPLFRSRFRSSPIASERYLLAAARYVHRNPLELGVKIHGYPWSDYDDHVAPSRSPEHPRRSLLVDLVGSPAAYRNLVETDLASDRFTLAHGTREFPSRPRTARGHSGFATVENAVIATAGITLAQLRSAQPGVFNPARAAVILLAVDSGALAPDEIARWAGLKSASGVRTAVARARSRAERDPAFRELISEARHRFEQTRRAVA